MSVKTKLKPLSVEEYLDGERHSDIRHEYIAGRVVAMTGASRHHNSIAGALYAALYHHLGDDPCRVHIADLKVRVDDAFYYPDVLVTCTPGGHDYYETAPVLIVEVLSPATEARDRMEKRLAYQSLESLKEYVLAAQDQRQIEVYRRTPQGWELERFSADEELHLESVKLIVPMTKIYRDVAVR